MHEGFEASLSQRGLLTASLRPNNSVPYFTKEDQTHNQEYFTSSVRSNASVPYSFKKEPIIAHEPYDLLMPHGSQSSLSSLMTSNEVTARFCNFYETKREIATLFIL